MEKRTVIDQIEVTRDGYLNLRMAKEVIDDDGETVISSGWHRTTMPPGHDIDAQMAVVNKHLEEGLKCKPVAPDEIARVKALAPVVWTAAVIARHQARVATQMAELEASPKPAPSTAILGKASAAN